MDIQVNFQGAPYAFTLTDAAAVNKWLDKWTARMSKLAATNPRAGKAKKLFCRAIAVWPGGCPIDSGVLRSAPGPALADLHEDILAELRRLKKNHTQRPPTG